MVGGDLQESGRARPPRRDGVTVSVGGKLALLTVGAVSATLAIVGVLFHLVLRDMRQAEAWTAIHHAADLVDGLLTERSSRLMTAAATVAALRSVTAVAHLVEVYETPQNYLPQLFDVEKRGLAEALVAQLPMTGADGIVVTSHSHGLIAFGGHGEDGSLLHGFRTVVDGRRQVRLFLGDKAQDREPLLLSVMMPTRLTAAPLSGLRASPAGLLQYAQIPLLGSGDGAPQAEGAVVAASLVDDRFTRAVGQQGGLEVWLVPMERHDTPLSGLTVSAVLAAAPAGGGLWRVEHDHWYLGAMRRDLEGGSLLFLLGRSKTDEATELRALNISVAAALLAAALLVVPITLLAGRDLIGRPLARITGGIDRLLQGERLSEGHVQRRDEIGALAATLNTLLDTVQRREADLALSRAHYQTLYDRAPVGYATLAADDARLLDVNRAFLATLGADDDLIGRRLTDLSLDGDTMRRVDDLLQRLRGGGVVRDEEIALQGADGAEVHLSLSMDIDASETSPVVRVAALDVSERKRAERQLLQTLDALTRSHAELEEFARIAAHDLREPSRLVVSYVQLLERRVTGKLAGEDLEYLHYLGQSARLIYNMVQDVLDFSRAGTHDIPFNWIDCGKIVDNVLQSLQDTVSATDAAVTVDPLPVVYGSQLELPRVFDHLVRNAVKFRAPDRQPHVRISAAVLPGEWRFAVSDNGIGIEPEYFEQIFGVFRRLHGRDSYPGTGIGLAICKRVVEHHKGRIWVESRPGEGSIFYFTIPQPARQSAAAA